MDCNEVLEYSSAAIDGEVDTTIGSQINQHILQCAGCRNELELERITKRIIARNFQRVKAPHVLAAQISDRLAKATIDVERRSWYEELLDLLTWRTALAVSGALAVIVLLTFIPSKSHHSHLQPNDGNIIHQTYNNFDGVLDGKIVPTVSSTDPSVVKAYFDSKVSFHVSVPRLKRCALLGGVFSEYKNECLAHVVYKRGDNIIYMYQTKLRSVMADHDLNLPAQAKHDLEQTGWYFENHTPDCSLAVWIIDSTICCAVADIDKEQLLACLKNEE